MSLLRKIQIWVLDVWISEAMARQEYHLGFGDVICANIFADRAARLRVKRAKVVQSILRRP